MSDVLDETGLTLKTLPEIKADLESGYRAIYGDDINLDQDSPDGQAVNIQAQEGIDLREVLRDVYTSFDPDQAQGRVLDQRVAINGLERKGGTYTITPVSITVDRNVSLVGLDGEESKAGVYTVKDDAGTKFFLVASTALTAGTHVLSFRAENLGAVLVTIGTITTPVTAIAGVTAINNSSSVTTQGVDEESDAELRIRRKKSVSNVASSYLDSIEGNLLDVEGVSEVAVYENVTDTTDGDGIPPHSIWAIVVGGSNADIGAVLYAKKTAGAGFKGSVSVDVPRSNGRTYPVKFDRSTDEDLYVKFSISLPGSGAIDTDALAASIVENVLFGMGEDATSSAITGYIMTLNAKYRVTNMLVSKDGLSWLEAVSPDSKGGRLVMDVSRMTISA